MRDLGEFQQHWRPLLGSFLGMGSALSLNSYILSTFAPYMIRDFGWSRSQWAMLGVVQFLVMICLPIAGRLTDMFGVRRVRPLVLSAFRLSWSPLQRSTVTYGFTWEYISHRRLSVRRRQRQSILGWSPPHFP